jgi:aminoglycoside phosphotransferase family enzyme
MAEIHTWKICFIYSNTLKKLPKYKSAGVGHGDYKCRAVVISRKEPRIFSSVEFASLSLLERTEPFANI